MLSRRRVGVLVAVAMLAAVPAACGSGGSGGGNEARTDEIPVTLSIKLRGDREATVDKQVVTSRFILIRREKAAERELNILGVEPVAPIKVGNVALITGVAVHPYRGDGTYKIQPGSAQDPLTEEQKAKASGSKSSVRVEWWPDGDLTGQNTEEFLRREKECTVKVEDDGTKGRVSCPSIVGQDVRFSLEMTWDVV